MVIDAAREHQARALVRAPAPRPGGGGEAEAAGGCCS
jgi:hypothetical protein